MKPYRILLTSLLLCGGIYSVQAQPQYNRPHGLYTNLVRVTITPSEAGAPIHYTLDGSTPTTDSPRYTETLKFTETTILRSIEDWGDGTTSPVTTASYIFPSSVVNQQGTPDGYPTEWGAFCQIDGTAPAYYDMFRGFDNQKQADLMVTEGLYQLPILSLVTDKEHLFSHERDSVKGGIYIHTGTPVGDGIGRGWERPVSAELIGGPEGHDMTVDCGIVIHGGHGRLPEKNPKHSFRLKFKEEYGPGTLTYPLFGEGAPVKFNQLVLRCHFGNSWQHHNQSYRTRAQYTRDMWARTTQRRLGHTAVEGAYVHLFLNGLYWGLYNIAERIDDRFCKEHLGGKRDDYDVIKIEEELGDIADASEGNLDAWNAMISIAQRANTNEGYFALQGMNAQGERIDSMEVMLDIDGFIDYMLINQYAGNNDWDGHNWYALRRRGAGSDGFHFLCWDSEQIFEGVGDNRLDLNNAGKPTGIFRQLIQNIPFRRRYIDRAYELLVAPGGQLTEEKVIEVWDSLYAIIDTALYAESARWGNYRREVHPYSSRGNRFRVAPYYLDERNRLLTKYFPIRSAELISQLRKKHWYPQETVAPTLLVNGTDTIMTDTLYTDDTLTMEGPYVIVYTTDGTAPISWVESTAGLMTSTATVYDEKNLLDQLPASTLGTWVTLRAIGMSSGEWGPAVKRRFYISPYTTDIATTVSTQYPTGIYDLQGRKVADGDDTRHLPAGIYIKDGKKVVIH